MKRIKQIEESKSMIAEAFLKLLETNSLEDITISEIAAEAKVGRNTLYNHFQKKEDILDYIMKKLLSEAKEILLGSGAQSLNEILYWRFSLLKRNPQFLVFQNEYDISLVLKHFREENFSIFTSLKSLDEYSREFILGGLDSITSRWIKNGMKESPDEIVKKVLSFINKDSLH